MKFIKNHILGLLGVLLIFFDLVYILLREPFHLTYIDRLILLIGISLCLAEFLPERTKISLSNFTLNHAVDKMISKYGIAFLFFLIIIGFYLRFSNLGNLSFWVDELFTTYAAIGIFQQGSPVMPSGSLYTRSIFNTNLIALSFKIFGVSEFSARLVSVVFGTLTIILVYLMGAKVANKRVGLLAAILITFSVLEIVWSRQARMYAQFQFFYLLTAYLFYLGLNKKDLRILLLSAIAFYGAYLDQILALSFLPVVVVYIIYNKREMLKNRYFVYGSLAIFLLVSSFMIMTGKIPLNPILDFLNSISFKQQFYTYAIGETKNLLLLVFIGITISMILLKFGVFKDKSNYSYILLNFFIPFLILILYSRKEFRYALFIFPFLFISASIAIDLYVLRNIINEDVITRISNTVKLKIDLLRKIKFATIFIMLILLLMQVALSIDAFHISQQDHGDVYGAMFFSNWKKGCDYVESRYVEGDKIITTLPLATMYYCGKTDYYIGKIGDIESTGPDPLIDGYSGAITLNTYEFFMETITNNNRGWVIVDDRIDWYLIDTRVRDYIDPRVRNYIRNNMTFHPDGSDNTIEVYSWTGKK